MELNKLIRKRDSLQRKKFECLNKILQMSKNFNKIEKEKGYGRASLNYANACKNVDVIDREINKIGKEIKKLKNKKSK
jgi:hypothetical protein|tara:strand:- start:2401 stop:2634 length:234 start_codon:yes stop_codon:yes gene_type:complete